MEAKRNDTNLNAMHVAAIKHWQLLRTIMRYQKNRMIGLNVEERLQKMRTGYGTEDKPD